MCQRRRIPSGEKMTRCLCAAALVACAWAFSLSPVSSQNKPLPNLDPDHPIEITADSLEVTQDENIAIFRGNVDALRGEMRLHADELTVHYRSAGGSGSGVNAISRIDAYMKTKKC